MISNHSDPSDLSLICYPNPVLRQMARPVEVVDDRIARIGEQMIDIMVDSGGVGLAAPQVGLPLRIIVVSPSGKSQDAQVLINPVLSEFNGVSEMEEGCLSVPDVRARVRRAAVCTLDALDIDGGRFHLDAVDFYATILQHEVDHLDGKLFIDRLNTLSKMAIRRKLRVLESTYQAQPR